MRADFNSELAAHVALATSLDAQLVAERRKLKRGLEMGSLGAHIQRACVPAATWQRDGDVAFISPGGFIRVTAADSSLREAAAAAGALARTIALRRTELIQGHERLVVNDAAEKRAADRVLLEAKERPARERRRMLTFLWTGLGVFLFTVTF